MDTSTENLPQENTPTPPPAISDPNKAFKAISNCLMPRDQRLFGSKNWNTWISTLILYLRIIKIDYFFHDTSKYLECPDEIKIQALLIIRQNLTAEPLSLIFDTTDPYEALNTLKASYEGSGPVLRQQLYLEFHSIRYEHYKSLNEFISSFKAYTKKLSNVGAKIEDIDLKIVFIAALSASFPI